jgi:hypothetical protein
MALKQGLTLLNTIDPPIQALFISTKLEQRLQRIATSVRLRWPITNFREIEAYKRRQKTAELAQWHRLPSKGKAVPFIDDRFGNAWLYDPSLPKPSRFFTALRLRSGMTSDRVT